MPENRDRTKKDAFFENMGKSSSTPELDRETKKVEEK